MHHVPVETGVEYCCGLQRQPDCELICSFCHPHERFVCSFFSRTQYSCVLVTMAAAVTTMIPASMNAVIAATEPGGAPTVRVASRPVPAPAAEEVLIQVHATGTNRAEILQAA